MRHWLEWKKNKDEETITIKLYDDVTNTIETVTLKDPDRTNLKAM